jgi:hypothetical protein
VTRDEHRAACIEAMRAAFYARTSGERTSVYEALTAAFEAIPTAGADVVPTEATVEMLLHGSLQSTLSGVWRAMRIVGSLTNPQKAFPDEPTFVLLARDPIAPDLIRQWAEQRLEEGEDRSKVNKAFECADAMEQWRLANSPEKKP